MEIRLKKIRIANFRSLKDVTVDFDDYTVLIGRNNAGKSNIIRAIELAFSYTNATKEDIFVSADSSFDIKSKIIIDVNIVPILNNNTNGEFDNTWTRQFGDSIGVDLEEKNFFSFRTEISYDNSKEIFINNKSKIDSWEKDAVSVGSAIKRDVFYALDIISISAQRDIAFDLKDRKSVWGRLISKIKISDDISSDFKEKLNTINQEIINSSSILKDISAELTHATSKNNSTVEICPITRDIESLYKGMDITYTDSNSCPISVENLGLGVRSYAVFSTIKAEVKVKISKSSSEDTAYHPIVLCEEPEAHIHPQAQRQLLSDILKIAGQKIITTHSPYILSQVDLRKIRYVSKDACNTTVVPLIVEDLTPNEIRKIERTVINTRGEILYSTAVIMAEGETEEQAIPRFLKEYFKKEPFELGINTVQVGGGNYDPFIKILNRLNIPWYIFSDGESEPLSKLKKAIKRALSLDVEPDFNNYPNVFVLEDGTNFETYLVNKGYSDVIISAINKVEKENGHNDNYFQYYIEQQKRGSHYLDDKETLLQYMKKNKTKYANAIADTICGMPDETKRIPEKFRFLFDKIKEDLKL